MTWTQLGIVAPGNDWFWFDTATSAEWFKVVQSNPPSNVSLQFGQKDGELLYLPSAIARSEPGSQLLYLPCPSPLNAARMIGVKRRYRLDLTQSWTLDLYYWKSTPPAPAFRGVPLQPTEPDFIDGGTY